MHAWVISLPTEKVGFSRDLLSLNSNLGPFDDPHQVKNTQANFGDFFLPLFGEIRK